MKRIFLLSLFLAVALVACNPTDKSAPTRHIVYAVQNADVYAGSMSASTTVSLTDDEAWDALLDHFCDYAQAGNTVTFFNPDNALFNHPAKGKTKAKDASNKAHTIKTTDKEAMKEWCRQMEKDGLTVVIDYDKNTGTWSGYAYALPPSQSSHTLTYISNVNNLKVLLTVDTLMRRLYITAADCGSLYLGINQGVISYNYFNAPDSGLAPNPAWTYLYMHDLYHDSIHTDCHYAVTSAPLYAFSSSAFSLRNLDLDDLQWDFTSTSLYDTWVCEDFGLNIVLHVERSTVDTTSYSFSGQFAMQTNEMILPYLGGSLSSIGGSGSTNSECDEVVVISLGDGSNQSFDVELITDDLVVWHLGDAKLEFHRI